MPVSLRLPPGVEEELAVYAARKGLSKSSVIVQSIREYLAARAQPSAHALYEAAMREVSEPEAAHVDARARKRTFREQVRAKQDRRRVGS